MSAHDESPWGTGSRAEDFADFGGRAYLDGARFSPMPIVSRKAAEQALLEKCEPWRVPPEALFTVPQAIRELVAQMWRATPEEITVGTATTHGTNLAAFGLPLEAGEEVALTPRQFPANVVPWRVHGERRGYAVRELDIPTYWSAEDVDRAAGVRTRAIAVPLVHHVSGFRPDLPALRELCDARGWYLVVDACQAAGGIDISVPDFRPDVLATGAYKWLLGPYGSGFAYVRRDLQAEITVPLVNWQGLQGADDVATREHATELAESARRFDSPETASYFNLYALRASLQYLLEHGVDAIERHRLHLESRLRDGLPPRFETLGSQDPARRGAILSLRAEGLEAAAIHAHLQEAGVFAGMREGWVRLSAGIYNDSADIDRALEAIAQVAG